MKSVPLWPTLLVGLAVAAIALGVWQLDRRAQKEALLAGYGRASARPAMAFPPIPVGETYLFRRADAFCLEPVSEALEAGYNRKGERGWRHLIACRTGAEGPGFTVDIGWSVDFNTRSSWKGGAVSGIIGPAPDKRSVIARAFANAGPQPLLLVAGAAAGGLVPSAEPSLDGVPNNHLAYAVQWFLFAAIAAGIYILALRRRRRA
jgi:surfeit locus 1 family protein